ncbi:hypothetical protein GCM10010873_02020 [Cypionkella aquatica]|uniref:N-acetyltransferase domain-containing protein n=1 Tax=Cypionkella aquatica TaxID=1756042 RepID=A0AA37TNT3_9RHOB|nr:GNAT family N-acetyltransferase [Cypionkella aquatica]GLS85229.1 hypothetical protein GCM10010873_02020 [Cypionkella aquatica]
MIEIIPEWALTPDDEAQIAQLITLCFGDDFDNRSYHRHRPHLRVILRDQGQIIGHIALLLRPVRLGTRLTETTGLAEVCSHPDHRGTGIAGRLLQTAIRHARTAQTEYIILFGTAPLYAGHGFTRQTNILTFVDLAQNRTTAIISEPAETLMVLPLRGQIWPDNAPLDMLGPLF